uniref:Minor capsid protein P9 transmembrane helices domain-containing protein n=1 Tax=viral metagenome TaxID=1070528 RepID=A0A6C0FBR0_9ZZZZ|tara:strand:- start:24441 stop:25100 length:660 start_codon:yes stop_codon:yes gene_type:complete
MIKTPFWYNDISILYNKDSITEIFPSKRFDILRKLNAIVRLSIFYTLIMFFMKRDQKYLVIPVIVMGITWLIWYKQEDIHVDSIIKDSMSDKIEDLVKINDLSTECRVPNKDNPFMNPTLTDYGSNLQPPPKSCPSYNNKGVQRRVEELFNEDLYRDVTDVFGKNNSQRQFYTVPGNQVPNDQGAFAQWCYGTPPTCKEGNQMACLTGMGRSGGTKSRG